MVDKKGVKKADKKEDDLKKQVFEMYTPLSVAKEEIWRRWNDKKLRKKVEDFLGGDLPNFLGKEPKAVLVRDIISPNEEFKYFLDLSDEIGLDPAFVEYIDGKFVAKNFNKYNLCKMSFNEVTKRGEIDRLSTLRIVDFNKWEGKKIKDVKTIWGNSLVDFHHELLKRFDSDLKGKKPVDFSCWFNKHRRLSKYYYLHYLALFIVYGVLFDNFILSKGEKEFTRDKILPSFHQITKIFGIKPLVVPLTWIEDESKLYWWCYPNSVKNNVKANNSIII